MGPMRWRALVAVVGMTLGLLAIGPTNPAGATSGSPPPPWVAPAAGAGVVLDAGGVHTCAVHATGELACWGSNNQGAARPPAGAFTSVTAGWYHSCALRTDATIACWGRDADGQATPPAGSFLVVDAGGSSTCAIRSDHTLTCWGYSGGGLAPTPAGSFAAVSVDAAHGCAIRLDETVTCWGNNLLGQADAPAGAFGSISAGRDHTCGVLTSGDVACWGGEPDATVTDAPAGSFLTVASGADSACGVRADETLVCWGRSIGEDPPVGAFASVSVSNHACGVEVGGTVVCWGDKAYYPARTTPPSSSYRAAAAGSAELCLLARDATASCSGADPSYPQVPAGPFAEIDLDQIHGCGLRPAGTVECWGEDYMGGTEPPPGTFRTLSTGLKNGCGVRPDSTLECWGYDYMGKSTPPPGAFVDVSAGGLHTCGLRANRTVACWGDSWTGQTAAPGGIFAAITAGSSHSCALGFDGRAVCWGANGSGESTPPAGAFRSVAAGTSFTCAIRSVGTLVCWGSDWTGRATPPPGTFASLSVGDDFACGIRTDGVLQCWGNTTIIGEPFGPIVGPDGSGYHPVAPTRLLDSRLPNVGFAGKVVAGAPRSLTVTGLGGPSNVPLSATSVVLNVTVADPSKESYLSVFPTSSPVPTSSNLNFGAGQTVPNLVTVGLGAGGKVDLATAVGTTNVVADLVGYYDDGLTVGDRFTGTAPVRLLDSRIATGVWNGPLSVGAPRDLVVEAPGASNGVPATATAVVANVTVTGGSTPSFVSVWPSGGPKPGVSNLNLLPGQTIANLAVVGIGAGGAIRFANAVGSVHVIVDVLGYFDPSVGSRFHAVPPTRFLDTRAGIGLVGPVGPGQIRSVSVAGGAGTNVPVGATGIVANLTVADGTRETFVSVFPGGSSRPDPFSNLNAGPRQVVPNLAIVGLGPTGTLGVYNHLGSAAVIGDVVGYFHPT